MSLNMDVFFKENVVVEDETKDVYVTTRFRDGEGNVIPWKIRKLSTEKQERLKKKYLKVKGRDFKLNQEKYTEEIYTTCLAFPDLLSPELQDNYGATGPYDLLKKLLPNAGDMARLDDEIEKFNTNEDEFEELVEDAKN